MILFELNGKDLCFFLVVEKVAYKKVDVVLNGLVDDDRAEVSASFHDIFYGVCLIGSLFCFEVGGADGVKLLKFFLDMHHNLFLINSRFI